MIDVNYNEYKETIAQNMKLIVENHDLKEEIERLNNIINKTIEEIEKDRRKNYYDLVKKSFYCNKTDKLLDILKGVDKE